MKLVMGFFVTLLGTTVLFQYYERREAKLSVRRELASVRTLIENGKARAAFARCEGLRQRPLVRDLARETGAVCEHAALGVLREVVGAPMPDFVQAHALIAYVLNGENTGAEIEGQGIAASMPERYLAAIRTRLAARDFEGVERDLETLRGLYATDGAILRAAVLVEHDWARAVARDAFDRDDLNRLLAVAAAVTEDAPIELQGEVTSLVRAAFVGATEALGRAEDYAQAFRLLDHAARTVEPRPALHRAVASLQQEFLGRAFGEALPASVVPLAPALRVMWVGVPASGTVKVTNRSKAPLRLRLRGQESRDVTVAADANESLALPAGEYLVLARTQAREAALGVLSVAAGYEHQQVIELAAPAAPQVTRSGRHGRGRAPRA